MHKDAPATSASQTGVSLFRQIVRGKSWKRALLFGALAGMVIGVFDLVAFANEWRIGNWFDAFDTPVDWVMDSARDHFDSLDDLSAGALVLYSLVACTVYWTLISLLIALVCCFAWAGGIRRILRDRTCRRALKFGIGAGIFLGGSNFLAMLNEVEVLTRWFDFLDRPGVALAQAVVDRFGPEQIIPQSLAGEGIYLFVATMAYWVIIGFLPAMLYCAVRVLRMRNDATGPQICVEGLAAKKKSDGSPVT